MKNGTPKELLLSCSVAPFFQLCFGGCPTKMVQAPNRFPFFAQGLASQLRLEWKCPGPHKIADLGGFLAWALVPLFVSVAHVQWKLTLILSWQGASPKIAQTCSWSLLLRMEKWLVITLNNGWSWTRFSRVMQTPGSLKRQVSLGSNRSPKLEVRVSMTLPGSFLGWGPYSWLSLGHILHFCFLWFVGNPHLTAKSYLFWFPSNVD